jgi:ribosomal-protein-alanine N-acetyltransferase
MLLEVRSDNVPAQRLYERAGFRIDGIRRAYYAPGVDAVLMSKRLGEDDGRHP